MAAVFAGEAVVAAALRGRGSRRRIAAVNGPEQTWSRARAAAVDAVLAELQARGVRGQAPDGLARRSTRRCWTRCSTRSSALAAKVAWSPRRASASSRTSPAARPTRRACQRDVLAPPRCASRCASPTACARWPRRGARSSSRSARRRPCSGWRRAVCPVGRGRLAAVAAPRPRRLGDRCSRAWRRCGRAACAVDWDGFERGVPPAARRAADLAVRARALLGGRRVPCRARGQRGAERPAASAARRAATLGARHAQFERDRPAAARRSWASIASTAWRSRRRRLSSRWRWRPSAAGPRRVVRRRGSAHPPPLQFPEDGERVVQVLRRPTSHPARPS